MCSVAVPKNEYLRITAVFSGIIYKIKIFDYVSNLGRPEKYGYI
jgi:hypothetical protein